MCFGFSYLIAPNILHTIVIFVKQIKILIKLYFTQQKKCQTLRKCLTFFLVEFFTFI